MRVVVLGEPGIETAGALFRPARRAARLLLGMLALRANTPLSLDWIAACLWPERRPKSAPANVRSHVAELRSLLASGGDRVRIDARDGGYVLCTEPDGVDVLLFRGLLADGHRLSSADAPHSAAARFAEALALWRGPVLAGLPMPTVLSGEVAALDEQRLTATSAHVAARIALGQAAEVVATLRGLVVEHPYHEQFREQLMIALHQLGRTGEALVAYRELRRLLRADLGAEPSTEITALYRRIGLGTPDGPLPRAVVPRQLPADVEHLVGRDDAVARLDRLLLRPGGAGQAPLAVVTGAAGVGKTALGTHWGHLRADRFPDGQLYCDLRGASRDDTLSATEVLGGFLRALGVPAERVPADEAQSAALFRSQLVGRQLLVVLDNATTESQVRPLRPAEPGCAVLVTSRSRLSGLLVHDDAGRLELAPLTPAQSTALLTRIVGPDRTSDLAALAEIAHRCGHLPLALRIAATRLRDDPAASLAAFAAELARAHLAALDVVGDERSAVSATFALSYRSLSADAAAVYRVLGLHPGPDAGPWALAVMSGLTGPAVRVALSELADLHLVRLGDERVAMHDLVALHARERAEAELTEPARTAAVTALYRHYLRGTNAAARTLYPTMVRLPDENTADDALPADLDTNPGAHRWLAAESDTLVAAITSAARLGVPRFAWLLTDALQGHFRAHLTIGRWQVSIDAGLTAARAATGPDGELALAAMLRNAGTMALKTGDRATALRRYREALGHYAGLDRPADLCALHNNMGMAYAEDARFAEAAAELRAALHHAERLDDPTSAGGVHANLAVLTDRNNLGRLAQSVEHATRSLESVRAGDLLALFSRSATLADSLRALGRRSEAARAAATAYEVVAAAPHLRTVPAVLDRLADLSRADGRLNEALDHASLALRVVGAREAAVEEASVRNTLGWVLTALGHRADAADQFAQALTLARQIGDPLAEVSALTGQATAGPAAEVVACLTAALAITIDRGLAVSEAIVRLSLARHAATDPLAMVAHLERAHRLCVDTGFHDGGLQVAELRAASAAG